MKRKIKVDGLIAFLLLAVTVWTGYVIYKTAVIPLKYRVVGIAVVSLLTLLMIALTFKRFAKIGLWIRRITSILLIVVLILGNTLYITRINKMLKDATSQSDKYIEKVSVIVKTDSSIKELDDLKGKKVGYQDSTDVDNAEYVKDEIDKKINKVKYHHENNYFTLSDQLFNDELDALIISDAYIASLNEHDESFSGKIRYIHTYNREVDRTDRVHSGKELDITTEIFTVLVSGMDETGTPDHNGLSDVNMLLIVNPNTNHLEMISFPRDSFIPNPALGGAYDKLTHTGNDGVENTMQAIEDIVGFNINFYVKVNFSTVVEIVDALGGVTVDVPIAFTEQNSERSFAPEDLISLEAGVQEVNGEEALAFARHRKTEGVGDIGRTKAQQQVISAIIQKVLSFEGAGAVPELMDIAGKFVNTNISEKQINAFVSDQLDDPKPWTYSQMTLENGFSDYLITASMGNMELSCYVLNSSDLDMVYNKYQAMINPINFNDFIFDLNKLDVASENMPKRPAVDIVNTLSDLSPYKAVVNHPIENEVIPPFEEEIPEEDNNEVVIPPEETIPPKEEEVVPPPVDGGEPPVEEESPEVPVE